MVSDQAAGLRRMVNPNPVKVLAVTSGKGGVGKTNLSVNLSVSLARMGRQVMLMDADLGLANVDVMLGLSPRFNLMHVLNGEKTIEDVIVKGPEGLMVIPAASGIQKMAELSPAEHAGVVRCFSELTIPLEYLIVDTAAGISDTVVSFSRAAKEVVVVVCDEPSSITDAYALIKVLNKDYGVEKFHMVANMVRSTSEGPDLYAKLSKVTNKFLDVTLEFLGQVPFDERLRLAVQKQKPITLSYPGSPASRGFVDLAKRIERWPAPRSADGHLEFFVERLIQFSSNPGEMAL